MSAACTYSVHYNLEFQGYHTSCILNVFKTGNKTRATCFATLLQNELNSDVARFTTQARTCLATSKVARFVFMGGKTRNNTIQLVVQPCCKTNCTFCCPFYRSLGRHLCHAGNRVCRFDVDMHEVRMYVNQVHEVIISIYNN